MISDITVAFQAKAALVLTFFSQTFHFSLHLLLPRCGASERRIPARERQTGRTSDRESESGGTLLPRFVSCSFVGFLRFFFFFVVCAEVQSVASAAAAAAAAERSGVSARPNACERERGSERNRERASEKGI